MKKWVAYPEVLQERQSFRGSVWASGMMRVSARTSDFHRAEKEIGCMAPARLFQNHGFVVSYHEEPTMTWENLPSRGMR